MTKFTKLLAQFIGPFLFLFVLFYPSELNLEQKNFLATFCLVVCLWLFTTIPLYISGLLGVCLSVLLGVVNATEAFSHFSSPIIFLFLGGFLFARAMHKTSLDKRISLSILSKDFIKGSFSRLIFALYALTAFFSMWVSNTATTAMMLPIILGTLDSLNIKDRKVTSLILLGMAYSASIGGLGTPIGSPPNIVAIGLLKELMGIQISFLNWTLIGTPFVILFLFILFKYISSRISSSHSSFDNSFLKEELTKLPPISSNEITIIILFLLTILFWFSPSFLKLVFDKGSEVSNLLSRLDSGIIAIFFSSLLFIFPLNGEKKILINDDIKRVDWGSLLLFGSGLSLGKILFKTGLAQIAGQFIISNLVGSSIFILFFVLIMFTIFSTELASNTASANILLPIVIALMIQLNTDPTLIVIAVALSCSLAFMLPVATPPNAIVYGSEKVEMKMMIKLGLILNLLFGFLMTISFYVLYQIK